MKQKIVKFIPISVKKESVSVLNLGLIRTDIGIQPVNQN